MRLSVILLVVAAFVATLDPTGAASDGKVAATNAHESITTEERGWFGETSTALSAFKKLVSQSGDDLVEAVSNLSKSEFNALFNKGKSQLAKMVPGFHPGMDLSDFGDVVRAAGLNDDLENALMVGYGKYLAHQMR